MKIPLFLQCFLFFAFFNSSYGQQVDRKGLLNDLRYFRDSLPAKHLNLFSKVSKQTFLKKCNDLERKIDKLDIDEFTIELFKINASIAEEHTILFPKHTVKFPLKLQLFDDGILVVGADSIYRNLLLSKILAINGVSYKQLNKKFHEVFKKDNPSYVKIWINYFLSKPEFLRGLGIVDTIDSNSFTVLTTSGEVIRTKIASVPIENKINYLYVDQYSTFLPYKNKGSYWFEMDTKRSILYFNYLQCRNDPEETFADFNKRLFNEIQNSKPEKLVLDLRFNGGGDNAVLNPFIESIKANYLNRKNSFFVLIGYNTFSSSLMNAIDLRRNTNSILIGEPTGGSINHYGELRSFELPSAKMKITYSTKYWENWKNHVGPLKPDHQVKRNYESFLNNLDEALEYIYRL